MLRPFVVFAAIVGFAGVSGAQQPVAPAPKVLVFPFAALGGDARASADLLRKNLVNAIDLLPEVDSLDPAKAEEALGKPLADSRDGCAEDDACMTALARAIGARYLVKGGVLQKDGGLTLALQLFDADAGKTVKEPETKTVATDDQGVHSMNLAAKWLFSLTGTLIVECAVPGADVLINSRPGGKRTTGDRPISFQVPTGRTHVRLEAPGYLPVEETVVIRPGGETRFRAELKQKPKAIAVKPAPTPVVGRPLLQKPLFWGAVAAGVAVVAGGVAVAASQGGSETKTKTVTDTGAEQPPSTTINSW